MKALLRMTLMTMILAVSAVPGVGSPFMTTVGFSAAPIGHYELCQRLPEECRQLTPTRLPVAMTRALWRRMVEVNDAANRSIPPRSDMDLWGVAEFWSYPDERGGDCEDIVLAKRRLLMEAGIPAGSLLITVVRQADGEGHAVLTVRTSAGDFILDNLEPRILRWNETPYRFLKRQSHRNSGVWVGIDTESIAAVASFR